MSQKEIGRIGQLRYGSKGSGSIFFEEFLHELRGVKGAQVYSEMADNDATVGAILFAIEMLMRNCEFHIEPAGKSAKDKEAAEFVESCMNDMERTWQETLSEILSFLTYGWSYHEIVYKRRVGRNTSPITNSKYADGLIGWRKLPIRAQDTLYGWEYKDDSDDLVGMTQAPPPNFEHLTIPIEKALHFRTRSRKDNPEGRSILRTAYRAYYFKKRLEEIEGYGMERDLAGFPVLYAPAEVNVWDDDPESQQTLNRAEAIVSSIRRDAREGLVLPGGADGQGWKLELLASGSKRQFDTNAIIDRYDKRIATSVLADFVMLGQQQVGSFALADSKTHIFALAIGTYLDVICEVFNNQAIPRLIDLNGDHFKGITDYPKMVHGDIEDKDLGQFASFIKEMVGAGIIAPDEELEGEVRRVGGLPEKTDTGTPKQTQPSENAPQESEKTPRSRRKKKQEETPADDEEDARKAQEAKKSLGRE
jgi:phage gp29-like protein